MIDLRDIGVDGWIKLSVWIARIARKLGAEGFILRAKHYITLQTLLPVHLQAVHQLRRLGLDICDQKIDDETAPHVARQAVDACTAMRNCMANLLDLSESQLHCNIKLFGSDGTILTWARSKPRDDRPHELDAKVGRPITDGSVWCALLGKSDGRRAWRQHKCFACNDLLTASHRHQFICGRDNWQQFYKSILAYPLMYRDEADATEAHVFGFLSFDSPNSRVFLGTPNIYDYCEADQWSNYHDRLQGNATFHLGAIMADTLSMVLKPLYAEIDTEVFRQSHNA